MHGSLRSMRCDYRSEEMDAIEKFEKSTVVHHAEKRESCDQILYFLVIRPKKLDEINIEIKNADLFVSIELGVVYPAAGFVAHARDNGAICVEINKEKAK